MKKSIFTAAFVGTLALVLAGCCHCGKNCPPPPPPQQPPCPMMKGECPPPPMCPGKPGCPMMKGEFPPPPCPMCHKAPGCPMMKSECPDKPGCPMMKDCKRGPRRDHPGKEEFKKRMDAMKQLREKYPQEMLEIDIAIIAQEDKVDALAVKAGIDLPKRPADFRRLRVAFPKEMQELEANAPNMKPEEFRKAIQALQEKLKK